MTLRPTVRLYEIDPRMIGAHTFEILCMQALVKLAFNCNVQFSWHTAESNASPLNAKFMKQRLSL